MRWWRAYLIIFGVCIRTCLGWLQPMSASCPPGWLMDGAACLYTPGMVSPTDGGAGAASDRVPWDRARATCREVGARLAVVDGPGQLHRLSHSALRPPADGASASWHTSAVLDAAAQSWQWLGNGQLVDFDRLRMRPPANAPAEATLALLIQGGEFFQPPTADRPTWRDANATLVATSKWTERTPLCEVVADSWRTQLDPYVFVDPVNYGSSSTSTRPRIVVHPTDVVHFGAGDGRPHATLHCAVAGDPLPNVTWFAGARPMDRLHPLSRLAVQTGDSLVFTQVTREVYGSYYCVAANKYGSIKSLTASIKAGYLESFAASRLDVYADKGFGKVIDCDPPDHFPRALEHDFLVASTLVDTSASTVTLTYAWSVATGGAASHSHAGSGVSGRLRGGNSQRAHDRLFVRHTERVFVSHDGRLYFSHVARIDEGSYACNVLSGEMHKGHYGPAFSLHVVGDGNGDHGAEIPSEFIKVSPATPTIGMPVQLECFAFGQPSPRYTWRLVTRTDSTSSPINSAEDTPLTITAERQHPDGANQHFGAAANGQPTTTGVAASAGYELSSYGRVLFIARLKPQHLGVYECTADNGVGRSASKVLTLTAAVGARITRPLGEHLVSPGSGFTLDCAASGRPRPDAIEWLHDGVPLSPLLMDDVDRRRITIRGNSLSISGAVPTDSGVYQCTAGNEHNAAQADGYVSVRKLPPTEDGGIRGYENVVYLDTTSQAVGKGVYKVKTVFAVSGGNAMIPCAPEAWPRPNCLWRRSKTGIVTLSGRHKMTPTGGQTSALMIFPVIKSDEDIYSCTAANEWGAHTQRTQLIVLPRVRLALHPSPTVRTVSNSSGVHIECRLDCGTTACPPAVFSWQFNGAPLQPTQPGDDKSLPQFRGALFQGPQLVDKADVDSAIVSTLWLPRITKQHQGFYMCRVDTLGGAGHTSATTFLTVGTPPPPAVRLRVLLDARDTPSTTVPLQSVLAGSVQPLVVTSASLLEWAFAPPHESTLGADTGTGSGLRASETLSSRTPDGFIVFARRIVEAAIGALYARARPDAETSVGRMPLYRLTLSTVALQPGALYELAVASSNAYGVSRVSTSRVVVRAAAQRPSVAPKGILAVATTTGDVLLTWRPVPPAQWGDTQLGYSISWRRAVATGSTVTESTVPLHDPFVDNYTLALGQLDTDRVVARIDATMGDMRQLCALGPLHYRINIRAHNSMGIGPEYDFPTVTLENEQEIRIEQAVWREAFSDFAVSTYNESTLNISWTTQENKEICGSSISAVEARCYGAPDTSAVHKSVVLLEANSTLVAGLMPNTEYTCSLAALLSDGRRVALHRDERGATRSGRTAKLPPDIRNAVADVHIEWNSVDRTDSDGGALLTWTFDQPVGGQYEVIEGFQIHIFSGDTSTSSYTTSISLSELDLSSTSHYASVQLTNMRPMHMYCVCVTPGTQYTGQRGRLDRQLAHELRCCVRYRHLPHNEARATDRLNSGTALTRMYAVVTANAAHGLTPGWGALLAGIIILMGLHFLDVRLRL